MSQELPKDLPRCSSRRDSKGEPRLARSSTTLIRTKSQLAKSLPPGCYFVFAALVAISFLIGNWLGRWSNKKTDPGVGVDLVHLDNTQCVIRVSITNNSPYRTLRINEGEFPWNLSGDRMTIALVEQDHFLKLALPKLPVIMDTPVPLPIKIQPGDLRSREIHLEYLYGSLMTCLEKGKVSLLWAYRVPRETAQSDQILTGELELPSQKQISK